MSQDAFSMLAVVAALTFLTMALTACASSERVTTAAEPVQIAAVELPPRVPEIHGTNSLRGELPSEN